MGKLMGLALALACAGCSAAREEAAPVVVAPSVPHPNSLAGQMARPWHHVGARVPAEKFEQDQAECRMMGQMAPVGAGSPEIKFLAVYIDCLKSKGYQPDPPKTDG